MKKAKILSYLIFPVMLLNFIGVPDNFFAILDKPASNLSDDFTAVNISGAFNVIIEYGAVNSYEIEASDSDKPKVVAKVEDGTLYISHKKNGDQKLAGKVKIKISLKDISNLTISGANTVKLKGAKCENLTVKSSGANNLELNGEAGILKMEISGACTVNAENLMSGSAEIETSGASSVTLNVSKELTVNASGVSTVIYSGDPKVNKTVSGLATVKRKS